MTDLDVRDALHRLAAQAGPPRGQDTADAAIGLARRQRRVRAAWAGGALAVALLAGAVPAVLPDAGPAAGQAATDRTTQAAPGLFDVPTRGSLAGDEAFVAGVAALEWSAPVGLNGTELRPPADSRRVLFAGDLPGGRRWALVMGADGGQRVYAWFGGPAGAAPGELTLLAQPQRGSLAQPVVLLEATGEQALLVVIGLPGDSARYSPGTVRFDDVTVGRVWTDLRGDDGVLVTEVDRPVYVGAETVEVVRDGEVVTTARGVPRTETSGGAEQWAFAQPVDERLYGDPAAQKRFVTCLPEDFRVTFGPDGSTTFTYPPIEGERSDVELMGIYAGWDAILADCAARAVGEG
ncbi:hypothetical protein [Geodermatophilus sp. SYSU D01119]